MGKQQQTAKKSILLVDDELLVRQSLCENLSHENFKVTVAVSGEEAIAKLKENTYDIVITDLMMEGVGGIGLLSKTKKLFPDLPVIILTGHGDMTSAVESLRLGADDYLSKPCQIEELTFRINSCLTKQELHLNTRQAEVKLQEAYSIINMSRSVVFRWKNNKNWSVEFITENVQKVFGYSAAEFISGKVRYADIIHPDDIDRVGKEVSRYSRQKDLGEFTHEPYRIITKAKEVKWIEDRTNIQRNKDGSITHFQGVVVEITKLKQAEKEIIQAKEDAEQANEAKSLFLSSMSHELRTPLNSILGFGQLLASDTDEPLSVKQQEKLDRIITSGRHLLELINDVLDLSRIESGTMDLSTEPICADTVLSESIDLVNQQAVENGIKFITDNMGSCHFIMADTMRFKQVVLNLLSNAIKYNTPGGEVAIACEVRNHGMVRITITDTGSGIAAEKLSGLFEPFNRLGHETSTIQGTGIGLTITKRLVEMMGGTLGVISDLGKGSTFYVDLPMSDKFAAIDDSNKQTCEKSAVSNGILQQDVTLLYVEDNQFNRQLVELIVEPYSHIQLHTAEDGQQGIDLARKLRPDVILMDLSLPGIDGFAALQRLTEFEETKNIPVIALSANAMPKDIERGLKAGFVSYLTKPINVAEFFQFIEEALTHCSVKK